MGDGAGREVNRGAAEDIRALFAIQWR